MKTTAQTDTFRRPAPGLVSAIARGIEARWSGVAQHASEELRGTLIDGEILAALCSKCEDSTRPYSIREIQAFRDDIAAAVRWS